MMLNDAAGKILHLQNNEPVPINDIGKIPKETDDQQEIEVTLKIRYYLLRNLKNNLKKKFGDNHPSINGYVCDKIEKSNEELQAQQHTTSLLFEGKEPRKDVLVKLLGIAEELESYHNFPNFKRQYLEHYIKTKLSNPDPRTLKKYVDCITGYVEKSTGKQIFFNQDYDLFNFKDIVYKKLKNLESYTSG